MMRNMRFGKTFAKVAPVMALGALTALAGCGGGMNFNGQQGAPLGELDMSPGTPSEIALLGPDRVEIRRGPQFDIAVEGSAADDLRFRLEDGTLSIMRSGSNWMGSSAMATVRVTMPEPPRTLTLSGSGEMVSRFLGPEVEIVIAGSGLAETPDVDAEKLEVSIAGSGVYRATGRVDRLELSVAGSGEADMAGLMADSADISIAGSGDAVLSSDGTVDASIMGSGGVTVRGSARCTVSSMGSGTVTCERGEQTAG